MAPPLEEIADDIHLSNPHIPAKEFLKILNKARTWVYPWGIVFAIKNELHIHILKDYRKRVFLRPVIRKVLGQMFNEYDVLITAIMKSKPHALDFDLRIGWKIVGSNADVWMLEMTKKDFDHVWE